jgi:glycosyltransferase involved in cell wall biosynthesis
MPRISDPQPKLTVLLAVRDAAHEVAGQLDALAAQEWSQPWEVVVVDNGSRDRTREVVEGYRARLPQLRVIDAAERPGQAYALNQGIRAARADAVAFCDADDEVAPGWVAAMGEALQRHDFVAARSDVTKLNEPWLLATREPQPLGRLSTTSFAPYAPYAGSSSLGVRRSVHESLGGFDESMPVMFDLDYSLRAHECGVELQLVPDALMYYRYRSGLRAMFRQARTYAEQMALVQRRHEDRSARSRKPWLLRGWKPILRELPFVHRRANRAKLAWLLGWQAGRFIGSARYRVKAL